MAKSSRAAGRLNRAPLRALLSLPFCSLPCTANTMLVATQGISNKAQAKLQKEIPPYTREILYKTNSIQIASLFFLANCRKSFRDHLLSVSLAKFYVLRQ